MRFEDIDANLRHTLCLLAARRPTGELHEAGGVTLASAGVRFGMFNAALISAPVAAREEGLAGRIAAAATHFRSRRLDWSCWVCEHWLEECIRPRADGIFSSFGLHRAATYPGMLAERIVPPQRSLPALEIRRIEDAATRLSFCQVGCVCFRARFEWFREIFDRERLWGDDLAGYVGYLHGEPIATALTVVGAGAVGIYNVATLPVYQRRGYGEALVRHGLEEARRSTGIERTILQSSPQGFSLYARMGYRTVTRFNVYAAS
jgi:GNAT superfamily N-acetyltransferase